MNDSMSEIKYQPVLFNPKEFAKQKGKKSPSFKAEYEALEDEFTTLSALLQARQEAALTQAEVAARMDLSKSGVVHREKSLTN